MLYRTIYNIQQIIQYQLLKQVMIEIGKAESIPQQSEREKGGKGEEKSTILSIDKQRASHIVLSVLSILLIVFSVGSAIGLLAVSATNSQISSAKGTTVLLMLVAGAISLVAVGAVLMSWKKVKWYLHMYEFACLVVMVLLVLVLVGTVMSNSSPAAIATCASPTNYFEYEMYNVAINGGNLLCSANCPCPQYTQVQQCPGWTSTPADAIMQQLQIQFRCSGWCQTNANANFIFSGVDNTVKPTGPCYSEWSNWVSSQWNSIVGCTSTIIVILFLNILSANWRILKICTTDE